MSFDDIMTVYKITDSGLYSQIHCVVARTMDDAIRIWRDKYKSSPHGIEVYSEYVLVAENAEESATLQARAEAAESRIIELHHAIEIQMHNATQVVRECAGWMARAEKAEAKLAAERERADVLAEKAQHFADALVNEIARAEMAEAERDAARDALVALNKLAHE